MGVTGLWKLIEQSGTPVPPDTLENKILAVDISIWLHQAVKGFQDSSGAALPHAHLLSLYSRVCKLLHYRIRPVFVFDGGVPFLKRETIRKRAQNKRNYRAQAERLQKQLAESVERETLIRLAMAQPNNASDGASTSAASSAALLSPIKGPMLNAMPTDLGRDAMFVLPPMPAAESSAATLSTSLNTSTASDDSEAAVNAYNINLATIDVRGSHFRSLPADVRHEILTDLKAMRKESSWGRLHELPEQRDEFSDFQMQRLLKRRQVQQSLEQAEQEMGGASLSLAEIERLLREDGVVDAESLDEMATQRVSSDSNKRILHVKSLRVALREQQQQQQKQQDLVVQMEDIVAQNDSDDGEASPPKKVKLDAAPTTGGDDAAALIEEDIDDDDDENLQLAIKMSLEAEAVETPAKQVKSIQIGDEFNDELQQAIRLSLQPAASDEVATEENIHEISSTNDDDAVSSNADSDFVEVPDNEDINSADSSFVRPLFETNEAPAPDPSMDFRHADLMLQVIIDPTQKPAEPEDDLFADIFAPKIEPVQSSSSCGKPEATEEVNNTVASSVAPVSPVKPDCKDVGKLVPTAAKLDSILDRLNIEMQSLTKTNTPGKLKQADIATFINVTPIKSKSPSANKRDADTTPPPTVPSPFFRKKTPQSSCKKASQAPKASPNASAKKSLFADDPKDETAKPPEKEVAKPSTSVTAIVSAAEALRDATTAAELADLASSSRQTTRELLHERNKQDRLGVSISERMSDDCKQLLRMFGIPFVVAPMEAEAQCAHLNAASLTDGTITDDSDIWLFGGRTVYRHFFEHDKHVMEFRADEVQRKFKVERSNLIQMAMLVGSDYTTGVAGIGTVTALEILSAFQNTASKGSKTEGSNIDAPAINADDLLETLQRFRQWHADQTASSKLRALRKKLKNTALAADFPSPLVVESYIRPEVRSDLQPFSWCTPDAESLREFAKSTFGWTFARTDETLVPLLRRLEEKRPHQQTIRNYFVTQQRIDRREVTVSKRIRRAIDQLDRGPDAGDAEEESSTTDKAPPKRSRARKTARKSEDGKEKDSIPAAVSKNKRNTRASRRTAGDNNAEASVPTASTSKSPTISPAKRRPAARVPNFRPPIPQRDMEQEAQKRRKQEAAKIFKQSKAANE